MALDATVLAALLQSCAPNVAPATMVAIIRVESESNPYRIGVNSGAQLQRQPTNAADAVATARGLLRRGANFDVGLMQINSAMFSRLGVTPESVFDPCTNLRAGAHLLADNYSRAREAGHRDPLKAALSEYNTGSRARGLSNGYVGKVFAAAQGYAPNSAPSLRPAIFHPSGGSITANQIASLLMSAFGGRITDTIRSIHATYGAANSYHKFGQAVDFVPQGGVGAITRQQIRALMAANRVQIIELLGPSDPKHSDHWHIAFAAEGGAPTDQPSFVEARWTVGVNGNEQALAPEATPAAAYRVTAEITSTVDDRSASRDASPPPSWDVFAQAARRQRQLGASAERGL